MLFNDEFVFLHYPRSAGKSLTRYMIEAWQGPIHGLVSLRQTKELEDVMRPDVFLEAVGAHQTVSQAKAILAERGKHIEEFRAVFLGIRDPYDMAVSRYCFMRRTYQWNQDRPTFRKAHELEFEEFWLSYRANLGDAFLTIDGAVLENQRFIRFETLQEDLDAISVEYGFNPASLAHLNSTPHDHYSNYVKTPRCEQAIYERFRYLFDTGLYPRRPVS